MAFMKGSYRTLALCLFIAKFIIQLSLTKGLLQDQYVGCFYDINQPNGDISFDNSLTIESCIAKCPTTTYSTIQNRNACRCREDYGSELPDTSCNLTCSGNNNELCGGPTDHLNAYVVYTVCPIGTYGSACDKGCHCKRDAPCDRRTGNCPNGCYGNWSGSACNITTASLQYIGCYRDLSVDRSLEECAYCFYTGADNYSNSTLKSCFESCIQRNYSYAGSEYSYECFCGETYTKHGPLNESSCPDALSVYSECPVGNYGRSCVGRCHCLSDTRCIYRNGSCQSSLCRAGWTRASCNIRDCSTNNGDCYINETCVNIALRYSTIPMCQCSNGFQRNKTWENCTGEDVNSKTIVAAFVGFIIGVALTVAIAVTVFLVYRHRNGQTKSNQDNELMTTASTHEVNRYSSPVHESGCTVGSDSKSNVENSQNQRALESSDGYACLNPNDNEDRIYTSLQ